MTPAERIEILERAVSDLQRELRDRHGHAPPGDADLIDRTPIEMLPNTPPYVLTRLREGGITTVERLAAFLPMVTNRGAFGLAPADWTFAVKRLEEWRAAKAVNLASLCGSCTR